MHLFYRNGLTNWALPSLFRTDHGHPTVGLLLEYSAPKRAGWESPDFPREHLLDRWPQADPTYDLPGARETTYQRRAWPCRWLGASSTRCELWWQRRAYDHLTSWDFGRAKGPSCSLWILEVDLWGPSDCAWVQWQRHERPLEWWPYSGTFVGYTEKHREVLEEVWLTHE